jgi:hypothetical protein
MMELWQGPVDLQADHWHRWKKRPKDVKSQAIVNLLFVFILDDKSLNVRSSLAAFLPSSAAKPIIRKK